HLILIGPNGSHLGQSLYLRELLGREEGPPPPVDLDLEKRNGDFVRAAIRSGLVRACHDLSDGGLAIAIAEMCLAGKIGASVEIGPEHIHAALFGEDQARYIVTVAPDRLAELLSAAQAANVLAAELGRMGGERLRIGSFADLPLGELRERHERGFAR